MSSPLPRNIEVVNVAGKFAAISEQWSPKIVAEVNDTHVKLVKLHGEFVWHKHDHEDEMFLVISGVLTMRLEARTLTIRPGEFVVIPRGVMHCPAANDEVCVMLVEPRSTLNTGNVRNERTREELERI